MAAGTCSFDQWLIALEFAVHQSKLEPGLQTTAARARDAFGAVIWFVEIFGRRWSYIAGMRIPKIEVDVADTCAARKIILGHGLGMVVANWGTMTTAQQARLIGWVKRKTEMWMATAEHCNKMETSSTIGALR